MDILKERQIDRESINRVVNIIMNSDFKGRSAQIIASSLQLLSDLSSVVNQEVSKLEQEIDNEKQNKGQDLPVGNSTIKRGKK